ELRSGRTARSNYTAKEGVRHRHPRGDFLGFSYFFLSSSLPTSRWRSTAALGPKSSSSKNCRTSTSPSPSGPWRFGMRLAQSTTSSRDLTWITQYPAISSLLSVNGPSTMARFPPENLTRNPLELGRNPDRSRSTPAFISSSLYLAIADNNSSLGMTPASDSSLALTIIMNRMVFSPYPGGPKGQPFPTAFPGTTNVPGGNRHAAERVGAIPGLKSEIF